MATSSLTIVGSGIKFATQFTPEMQLYVERSEKVLYLVNESGVKEWIQQHNANTAPLDFLYEKGGPRVDIYRAITNYILDEVRKEQHVCVVIYGHPVLFAQPGLNAVLQAKAEGFDARVLPGISTADCLFADLLIDTGHYGYQCYEATDFLIHRRQFSTTSHLILWEVGIIGQLHYPFDPDNTHGTKILVEYLSQHYPLGHEVTLYEAAQYPGLEPRIEKIPLGQLPRAQFSPITTLYIPPATVARCDETMVKLLKINIADLYR
jgi:uncharacterized protein YabN with tetrapyrrole methylase and pyrophosphatase domain